ncbi:MAG TPA: 1-deoxy-D-xylulose-5-phosphate reductoisomerase [Blastocatellia bacterium]|nr:1-deoxy-D-xylulose-5-phosphate reductoisomerase [Blastocatellia bacterium]
MLVKKPVCHPSGEPVQSETVITTGRTKVAILGSTGSIGLNTLRVIESLPDRFSVAGLACGRSVELLAEQIRRHHPEVVAVSGPPEVEALAGLLADLPAAHMPQILTGVDGLVAVATESGAATVVSAAVGSLGFVPTYRALERGLRVALANKETLVVAGELMTAMAHATGAEILPVDSEHNALHQCLRGESTEDVRRLVLTASGGPFRTTSIAELENVTRAQALQHPTWRMGDKITIDSATLMNKGLEVIEAHWLFGFSADQIDVVVHPQSIVHSMVELCDGSIIAQMGITDMRHAIQYALTYPDRLASPCGFLDLLSTGPLEFFAPDLVRFPALRLAYEALRAGGTYPAALNAANEVAVAAFLDGALDFRGIPRVVEDVLGAHVATPADSIDAVLAADAAARQHARERVHATALSEP